MNTAKESNLKSLAIISFVSILLFGIFYYLITDISNSSQLSASSPSPSEIATAEAYTPPENNMEAAAPVDRPAVETIEDSEEEVKGNSTEVSVFKALTNKKVDAQPKSVLGGGDTAQTTESTVPATGSDTIFGMFVFSSLVMFTGIYLLMTQPKNKALAKFEKRIIKQLD